MFLYSRKYKRKFDIGSIYYFDISYFINTQFEFRFTQFLSYTGIANILYICVKFEENCKL